MVSNEELYPLLKDFYQDNKDNKYYYMSFDDDAILIKRLEKNGDNTICYTYTFSKLSPKFDEIKEELGIIDDVVEGWKNYNITDVDLTANAMNYTNKWVYSPDLSLFHLVKKEYVNDK